MSRDYRFRYVDILNNENPSPPADTCSTPSSVSNNGVFTSLNPIYQYHPTPQTTYPYIPIKQQLPNAQFTYPSFTSQQWSDKNFSKQTIPQENRTTVYENSYPSRPSQFTSYNSGFTSPQNMSIHSLNFPQSMPMDNYVNPTASVKMQSQEIREVHKVEKKDWSQQTKNIVKIISKILMKRCKNPFQSIRKVSNQENELVLLFTNHCATLIQKNWRKFIQQKYYKHYKIAVDRLKQLVRAAVEGWKLRRIMKTRTIQRMVDDIKKKQQEKKFPQMRIQKRDLAKQIAKLLKTGRWVEQYKNQRKTDKIKGGNFRFVTLANHPISTLGNSSIDQSVNSIQSRPSSNNRKKRSEQEPIPNKFDEMPLPTQVKSAMDEIPIKGNPNANCYNFDEVSIGDSSQSIKEEPKKALLPPKKKKVIKLTNADAPTNNPPINETKKSLSRDKPKKEQIVEPAKYGFNQRIKGDLEPLDNMSVAERSQVTQIRQKSIEKPQEQGDEKDQKKKFLKKRMKYDPKKAIQQEKKRKLAGVNSRLAPESSQDRSLEKNRPSHLNDLTMRPISTNPGPIRSKSPDITSKDFNATLKKFSKIQQSKIQVTIPVTQVNVSTKVISIKSPTYTRQRHINLNELQQTYSSAYTKKKAQMANIVQRLGRNSKKLSYPVTAIRQISEVYKNFDLRNYEDTEDLLERQFLSMLNM